MVEGVIYSQSNCTVVFNQYCKVIFSNSISRYGGGITSLDNSNVSVSGSVTVKFFSNNATYDGGALYFSGNSHFHGYIEATFNGNRATRRGGAIHSYNKCSVSFYAGSKVVFANNTANSGGAIFCNIKSDILYGYNSSNITLLKTLQIMEQPCILVNGQV